MNLGFIQILKHNTKIQAAPRGHRHTPQQPLSTLVNQSRSPYHHHLITETRFLWKRLLVPRYCCNRVETEDLSSRLQLVTGSSLCSTAGTQCLQSLRDSKGSHVGGGSLNQERLCVRVCIWVYMSVCVIVVAPEIWLLLTPEPWQTIEATKLWKLSSYCEFAYYCLCVNPVCSGDTPLTVHAGSQGLPCPRPISPLLQPLTFWLNTAT